MDVLRKKHPDMHVPPVENPMCAAFKEYKEVPEMVPLDLSEENFMWVASKLSDDTGVLGVEAMELRNWLLCFGCVSEDFIVVVSDLDYWVDNSPSPLSFLLCSDGITPRCTG